MTARNSKILVIPSWYPPDGGYFFKEHSEAINQLGWKVDLLVTRMVGIRKVFKQGLSAIQGFKQKDENGLNVYRSVFLKFPGNEEINVRRRTKHIFNRFKRYEKLNGNPDLILAHSVTWAGYAAYLIHKQFQVPYIIVEHRSYFVWSTPEARNMVKPFYLPLFEKAYRNCSKLVLVSPSLLIGLKTLFNWIEEKTSIIPNMIREDMFLPSAGKRLSNPFVFFWAGRLEHVKGLDILLKSVKELKNRSVPPFSVRLAGRGSLTNELMQMAEDLNIKEQIVFLGRLSREAMQTEMQQANCFVLPTRYEAFGAVLIEAMATGLPVIATRSGGPDSIVTESCGLLVDPDDAPALADAMEHMINNYTAFSEERIRSQTLQLYGQSTVMKQYDSLFRNLLKNKIIQ